MATGRVEQLWRFPVKSMQGGPVDELTVESLGAVGDRAWALVDAGTGQVLAAKLVPRLLGARAAEGRILLPDGTDVDLEVGPEADRVLSAWLERPVRLAPVVGSTSRSYEMSFEPLDRNAEVVEIPLRDGSFQDLAAVHLMAIPTLEACRAARPDLDWDLRRFRPNVLVDVDVAPFGEQAWVGAEVTVGAVVLSVFAPTVRCAVPLRAQPALVGVGGPVGGEPGLFRALRELNVEAPGHLGLYCEVVRPGAVRVGDEVRAPTG